MHKYIIIYYTILHIIVEISCTINAAPLTIRRLSGHFAALCAFSSYFFFVAIPPRIWRSCLFISRISFTAGYSDGLTTGSFSVRSLCTVDLLIPNSFAAARTVDLCSTIYSPKITDLSFTSALKRHNDKTINSDIMYFVHYMRSL